MGVKTPSASKGLRASLDTLQDLIETCQSLEDTANGPGALIALTFDYVTSDGVTLRAEYADREWTISTRTD